MTAWIYIVTNREHGVLYTGVTTNIARRAWEHRTSAIEGFSKRYHLTRLVLVEPHDGIRAAIAREKAIKSWPRAWKIELIVNANPAWADLYDLLAAGT